MARVSSGVLFPEHNSSSPCPDVSRQRGKCKFLAENVFQNPVIEQLVKGIRQSGCPFNFGRNVAYEKCAKNVCGGFDWKKHQVILCTDENQTEKKVLRALAHELVHMFDSCRAGFNLESVQDLACSEIRAANLIHCQPVHWSLVDPATKERRSCDIAECVKRTASHSVRSITGIDNASAKEVVEKAYVRCCADLEPFCKHLADRYGFKA